MKTCPICHAATFDDAETCFGCLHRFEEEEPPAAPMPANPPGNLPPAFLIRLAPTEEPSGAISWTCSVDLAPR